MREPARLRDSGLDPLAVELLDAARGHRRPAGTRGRILKALGLPIALSAVTPASAAVGASLAAKVVIVTAAAAIVAGGGVAAFQLRARQARRARVAATAAGEARPAPVVAAEPAAGATAPPVVAGGGPERPPLGALVSRPRLRRSPPPPPSPDGRPAAPAPLDQRSAPAAAAPLAAVAPLAEEIARLDAAERAERRHDHRAALASLDAYARSFPDGALRAEAEVLRIATLLASGDEAAARERGRWFLARFAPSPLAARVRLMLPEPSGPGLGRNKEPP
jgi:hypothetical protein